MMGFFAIQRFRLRVSGAFSTEDEGESGGCDATAALVTPRTDSVTQTQFISEKGDKEKI